MRPRAACRGVRRCSIGLSPAAGSPIDKATLRTGARMTGTGLQKLAFALLAALILYVAVTGGG
jgi:hypothetical protein